MYIDNKYGITEQLESRDDIDESILFSIKDSDIARCLLSYDQEFLKLAINENLLELTKHFLGTEFVLCA